jgi:hypothetical protein
MVDEPVDHSPAQTVGGGFGFLTNSAPELHRVDAQQ